MRITLSLKNGAILLATVLACLAMPACGGDDKKPDLDDEVTVQSIDVLYYVGSTTTTDVRFMVRNPTSTTINWIRFYVEYVDDDTNSKVYSNWFEFGSKTDSYSLNIEPHSTSFTSYQSCEIPLVFLTSDKYLLYTGNIEYSSAK